MLTGTTGRGARARRSWQTTEGTIYIYIYSSAMSLL